MSKINNQTLMGIAKIVFLVFVFQNCSQAQIKEDSIYFLNVDKTPEFKGGVEKMYRFIYRKNKVASYDEATGIDENATVIVSCIVEKDGRLSRIQLEGSGYKYKYNKEALRIVGCMPKWKPAMLNGKKVRCKKVIIVMFPPPNGIP